MAGAPRAPTSRLATHTGRVALPIDTSRAARSLSARRELVEAVRDAPVSEQETNWLEWKGWLDLTDKAAHAVLAKAVLGFSNRDPDRAGLEMAGTAYLLAGVEPGNLKGVQPVDMAALEPQVVTYTGQGPQWSGDYVEVDGKSVLVLTVEPPEWGDPIHPVRKAYLPSDKRQALQLSAIYVRHGAATETARPADIDMLTRRAQGKPKEDDRLVLDVRQDDGPGPGRVDVTDVTLGTYTNEQRARLMRPLQQHNRLGSVRTYDRLTRGEYRKPDEYEAEVSEYIVKLGKVLPTVLMARSVLHGVGALDLHVANPTDRPFTQVEVRVRLHHPDVGVITDEVEAKRGKYRLPEPPRFWGIPMADRGYGFSRVGASAFEVPNLWTPELVKHEDSVELVFKPRDVRPQSRADLSRVWLLLHTGEPTILQASWTATSTAALGQAGGSLTLRLDGRSWSPEELLADPKDD